MHATVLCPTFFPTNIHKNARGGDPAQEDLIQKLMDRSKLSARDVANEAIAAVLRNDLYAVPMTDGRVMWRIKRAHPQAYAKLVGSRRVRKFFNI